MKTEDIRVFTQYALLGWHIGRLQPGERLRVHQFQRATSNGDEVMASPYARESLQEIAADLAQRVDPAMTVGIDGLDLIAERP